MIISESLSFKHNEKVCMVDGNTRKYTINAGCMILKPNLKDYVDMMRALETFDSTTELEQEFLSQFYYQWNNLSYKYNFQFALSNYDNNIRASVYKKVLLQDIFIIHYSSQKKAYYYMQHLDDKEYTKFKPFFDIWIDAYNKYQVLNKVLSLDDFSSNGDVAKQIAKVIPYYSYKGIEQFYDIGGFLKDPNLFTLCINALITRYKAHDIDSICAVDARGFILGSPLALALEKPFFMLRKKGKMPNAFASRSYTKEYDEEDVLTISKEAVQSGDRILIIDDLIATGNTLCAGIELIKQSGGIPECAAIIELTFLKARDKLAQLGHQDVPIWALMTEQVLQ
jgi:adenine phosphoribosyltransferase